MTSLNPDQIYRRTQDSLNSLAHRLTDLIGSSNINSTIQREIELFGLYDEAADGNLSAQDLNPVINLLNNLNLQEITDRGYVKYNSGQNKFSLNMGKIQSDIAKGGDQIIEDFNGDGVVNVTDLKAFEHIINYQAKREITLEEQLAGIADPDLLVKRELELSAERRGLKTDPARYQAFITKFFDKYLKEDNLSRVEITKLIELHDIFEKEDANFNLDKLDYYAQKISEPDPTRKLPEKYLKTFAFQEAKSGSHDGIDELSAKIVSADQANDGRTLRTIDQILRSRSIPLTGQEFSMQNALTFLDDLNDPIKYPQMIMNSWVEKTIKPEDTEIKTAFKDQMQTYFDSYLEIYEGDTHKALATASKVKDLYINNYKKLKSELKKIDRNRYLDAAGNIDPVAKQRDIENSVAEFTQRIEKLNLYSELFVNLKSEENPEGYSTRNINIIFSYDNNKDFDLTGTDRETKLTEYLDILEAKVDANKAEFLDYIFKTRKIPFSPEGTPISSSNIDSFLTTLGNEETFFEVRLRDLADKSNLGSYPSADNSIYNEFITKFMSYKFDDGLTNSQITQNKYLFDNLKSKYPDGFNLTELDFYVNALVNDLAFSTIVKFINKLHFLPTTDKQNYMNILLAPGDSEEKATILKYLNF